MGRRLVMTVVVLLGAMAGEASWLRYSGISSQTPAQPVFSARSELVVLHVVVKDRKGAYVSGLTADAFAVFEDDQAHPIQFFATQDAPVTVGLLVDSSGSMLAVKDAVIAAIATFAETSHRQDEIFALAFNDDVRAALPSEAPFTNDPHALHLALTSTISARGRTALYDAIAAGLEYVEKGRHPRKVLVVLSDGGDNASAATLEQVLQRTLVENTVIYTIGLVDPLERDASPKRLKQLADVSGGEAFRPRSVSQVSDVLRHIASDIRNTYTIGYMPRDASPGAQIRRIRVSINRPNGPSLSIRARHGYVTER